jgi:DNA-binding IclR family transcriptional regulator
MPTAINDTATDRGPISQTLARGLSALRLIATSRNGLTIREVADYLGVHRTIAYRLINTLADLRFAVKGDDGRYRLAADPAHACTAANGDHAADKAAQPSDDS